MLLPYGEWDSTGRFLPGTEDCKWRLGLFGYRPLPCVTCIAHARNRSPIYPRRIMPNEKYKTFWSMQADVTRRSRRDHSVAPGESLLCSDKAYEVRCSPRRLRPEVTF